MHWTSPFHQTFNFYLYFVKDIALHQHHVKQVEIGSEKHFQSTFLNSLGKDKEDYVLYFPMDLPNRNNTMEKQQSQNLTMIPSFIQNPQ